MFAPCDILVLIMLTGSGILIWIARRSNLDHQKDEAKLHDHEKPPSAEQIEAESETNNYTGHHQTK